MISKGNKGEDVFLPPISATKYQRWAPVVDKAAFRERVKSYVRPEEWDENTFESTFFSFFYCRTSVSREEYEELARESANSILLPF